MSFFSFNEKSALATDSNAPITAGVYDATIDTVSTRTAATGTQGVDYSFILSDGRKAIVYGSWIRKATGETLLDGDKLNSLMGILGVKTLTEHDKTIEVKDGKKVVRALKELDGKKVKVALFNEQDIYNGEERKNLKIHSFFNEKGFSYSEIVANATEPKKINYVRNNIKDTTSKRAQKAEMFGADVAEESSAESLL